MLMVIGYFIVNPQTLKQLIMKLRPTQNEKITIRDLEETADPIGEAVLAVQREQEEEKEKDTPITRGANTGNGKNGGGTVGPSPTNTGKKPTAPKPATTKPIPKPLQPLVEIGGHQSLKKNGDLGGTLFDENTTTATTTSSQKARVTYGSERFPWTDEVSAQVARDLKNAKGKALNYKEKEKLVTAYSISANRPRKAVEVEIFENYQDGWRIRPFVKIEN
ncbi:hypothetical protein COV16_07080 [Candidatus Woesearchaeota archaeon CG10_big_fil_rev_8_21_14_0_10_34_8]|nr:MAG: hypothetical protein COV16_07080 [Candidatus Woesearchaeota archaeon CG10_big_fil_rev_8_21_14_0_10_34_8]